MHRVASQQDTDMCKVPWRVLSSGHCQLHPQPGHKTHQAIDFCALLHAKSCNVMSMVWLQRAVGHKTPRKPSGPEAHVAGLCTLMLLCAVNCALLATAAVVTHISASTSIGLAAGPPSSCKAVPVAAQQPLLKLLAIAPARRSYLHQHCACCRPFWADGCLPSCSAAAAGALHPLRWQSA